MQNIDYWQITQSKIMSQADAVQHMQHYKDQGNTIVFTNGCFDILHYGHLRYLCEARALGTKLVVGLNSDASVRRLKGENRPINTSETRALQLAALAFVNLVVVYEEDTPFELICALTPDLLVKGGDYTIDQVIGADHVQEMGGDVVILPFHTGYSTSAWLQKLAEK
jgi:D-glycero-beta-D-manno-heptose 1-phosphate adenylyltransferase